LLAFSSIVYLGGRLFIYGALPESHESAFVRSLEGELYSPKVVEKLYEVNLNDKERSRFRRKWDIYESSLSQLVQDGEVRLDSYSGRMSDWSDRGYKNCALLGSFVPLASGIFGVGQIILLSRREEDLVVSEI
jgi:hypothetical protein